MADEHAIFLNNGQLKIHIEYIAGHLQVHVIEARQLSSKWTATCDSYIQVSLIPDETLKTRWTSKTIYGTNTPSFLQTVDIELSSGDENKRLMISAWHMDSNKNCSEFLGCMSFGVKHLKSKAKRKPGVEGWYYLLSEQLGFRKHLSAPSSDSNNQTPGDKMTDSRPPLEGAPSSPAPHSQSADISLVNKKTRGLQSQTFVVHKTEAGYGFTVKSSCPVRVGRVKSHGPAEIAGLGRGDYIIRINGQNVSTATADTVAEIVRRSSKLLVIDVCRAAPSGSSISRYSQSSQAYSVISDSEISAKVDSQSGSSYQSDSQSLGSYNHSDEENIPPASLLYKSVPRMKPIGKHRLDDSPNHKHGRSESKRHHKEHAQTQRHHKEHEKTIETFPRSLDSTHIPANNTVISNTDGDRLNSKTDADGLSDSDHTMWDPEISVISATESLKNRHVYSHCDLSMSNICDRNLTNTQCPSSWSHWIETSLRKTESPWQLSTRDSLCRPAGESSDELLDKALLPGSIRSNDSALGSSGNSGSNSTSSSSKSVSDSSSHYDDPLRAAILNLVDCERHFAEVMQHGIQQYSRPLRHGLLAPAQHVAVFQNLEKLVALSEYNIRQLTEQSCGSDGSRQELFIDNIDIEEIADVYSTRVRLLCSAYSTYLEGLPSALHMVNKLHNNRHFASFVEKQCLPGLSIEKFLQHPHRHLVNITRSFMDLLRLLPTHRQEYESLVSVVNAIQSNCLK